MGVIDGAAWADSTSNLAQHVRRETDRTLQAYLTQPTLVREHVGIEDNVFSGGYGRRQIFELIQNAADAILAGGKPGRVEVVLTERALYCANEGAPIDEDGVTAILSAYLSQKRGAQIGHFGLGFKSVLNVTSTPQFFCRSGSFGFDGERSLERIREILPATQEVPVLRLAHVLEATEEARHDPELASLMTWATTVVRLPRNRGESSWLSNEIHEFPANFLIFSPHVSEVALIDRVVGTTRSIEIQSDDSIVIVNDDGEGAVWGVFARELATADLTEAELEDADRATRQRETLPLIWAVPDTSGRSRGRFWAFFPTETETTLSGILNAPWKTNADRQNLLDGPFNRRLLAEFGRIIRDAWSELQDDRDPGALLDILPARERDEKNWADSAASQSVLQELAVTACIPNGIGDLCKPEDVFLRPDETTSEGGRQWLAENPDAEGKLKKRWVHRSVETRERRPRAERLKCVKGRLSQWLEDVAAPGSSVASRRALSAVDAILPTSSTPATVNEIRQAAIVLTSKDECVAPIVSKVYLHVKGVDAPEGLVLVHAAVAKDKAANSALRRLGIKEVGVQVQLEIEIARAEPNWESVWLLLRILPQDSALAFVRANGPRLRVRVCDERFVPVRHALLSGRLLDPNDQDDAGVLIDPEFHKTDGVLLEAAGAVQEPVRGLRAKDFGAESWFASYVEAARADYRQHETRGYTSSIIVGPHDTTAGPLHVLVHGSPELRARLAEALIRVLPPSPHWECYYDTRPYAYARTKFVEPARWCLAKHGMFATPVGVTPTADCVGPKFSAWRHFLPVASVPESLAEEIGIPQSLAQFDERHWKRALERAVAIDAIELLEGVWSFYGHAAAHVSRPAQLNAIAEGKPLLASPAEVHVSDDRDRFNALQEAGLPAIFVTSREEVDALVENWGCLEGVAAVHFEPTAEPEPLLDRLPGLEIHISADVADSLLLQPCARLWLEINNRGNAQQREVTFAQSGSVLCYRADTPTEVLFDRVVRHLGLTVSVEDRSRALSYLDREQRRRVIDKVRAASTVPAKLLAAIGQQAIRRQLSHKVIEAALGVAPGSEDAVLAEAAVAVHGVEVLKAYAAELTDAGFDPPKQWNGGRRAAAFCEELGIPEEYAGFRGSSREPMVEVDGPVELKPLHDFQATIADRIRTFFLQPKPDRGLLSLPTGAGKTRVVVEAVIQALNEKSRPELVIWIAQSDELCEQAVQAWSQAWRSIGPPGRLRISRLWGATNDLVRPSDDTHIVVCTYHSLGPRLDTPHYAWLRDAVAVIIDEAHGSTSPAYTRILQGLGFSAQKQERHLVGLTATPFRGSGIDEEETRWLANRYGQNRFDQGAMPDEDAYAYLQDFGILARVEQQMLEGGQLHLSDQELAHLRQFNELPPAAEQRLGDDDARNMALVDAIVGMDRSWPVLLFATSVNHAQLMAALLSLKGIVSKAISGATDPGARRHYISEFKAGRIRVLTNYGVLTTGFDAPAVRALVIARPVYSRGLYQQMIGRGLRGPKNGGKERCLIVNVADNLAQYGERLAFRDFEHLWQPWQRN